MRSPISPWKVRNARLKTNADRAAVSLAPEPADLLHGIVHRQNILAHCLKSHSQQTVFDAVVKVLGLVPASCCMASDITTTLVQSKHKHQ